MTLMIARLGDSAPIRLAAQELHDYLSAMDPSSVISMMVAPAYEPALKDVLWVGQDAAFEEMLPAVADRELDDIICLKVKGCSGIVTGGNARSVLLAAYRLLRESGCAFIRPGKDGERIPRIALENISADLCETPAYRHRGVCIEGAVSYDHVVNMIRYLPKIGMNAYFIQFFVPTVFFDRWYEHDYNPKYPSHPLTRDQIACMKKAVVEEIAQRGLMFHDVGHGWTCEPFGVDGDTWDSAKVAEPPAEYMRLVAQVDGKRALWNGCPIDTNLCYGNAEVRNTVTNYMADYCQQNPAVDYIHFWLADGANNHCECPLCRDTTPSDFFVIMLNELAEKLDARNIKTRVVFLMYVDSLWAPQKEKLKDPDRFVMMFAPITRTYSQSFKSFTPFKGELPPYRRNKNKLPRGIGENVAHLKNWQKQIQCDGFDFDYHYMWDHIRDMAYYNLPRILMEDMQSLHSIGLNGMISCQNQRVFFPTALGMHAMAAGLWNETLDFEEMAARHFRDAFGDAGPRVQAYMRQLSDLLNFVYIRGEQPRVNPEQAQRYRDMRALVQDFRPIIRAEMAAPQDACVARSWYLLDRHAELMLLMADMLALRADGRNDEASAAWKKTREFVCDIEKDVHNEFDVWEYLSQYDVVMQKPAK